MSEQQAAAGEAWVVDVSWAVSWHSVGGAEIGGTAGPFASWEAAAAWAASLAPRGDSTASAYRSQVEDLIHEVVAPDLWVPVGAGGIGRLTPEGVVEVGTALAEDEGDAARAFQERKDSFWEAWRLGS